MFFLQCPWKYFSFFVFFIPLVNFEYFSFASLFFYFLLFLPLLSFPYLSYPFCDSRCTWLISFFVHPIAILILISFQSSSLSFSWFLFLLFLIPYTFSSFHSPFYLSLPLFLLIFRLSFNLPFIFFESSILLKINSFVIFSSLHSTISNFNTHLLQMKNIQNLQVE